MFELGIKDERVEKVLMFNPHFNSIEELVEALIPEKDGLM
jgi:hypothetical protein